MNKVFRKKGSTLIELIIVLAILAILAAFLLPSCFSYIKSTQEKSCSYNCSALSREISIKMLYSKLPISSLPTNSEVLAVLGNTKCPGGGVYSLDISSGVLVVNCDKHTKGVSTSSIFNLAKSLIPAKGWDSNFLRSAWAQKYGNNTAISYDGDNYVLNLATNTISRSAKGNDVLLYASLKWDQQPKISDRFAKIVYDPQSGAWYVYRSSVKTERYDIGRYVANNGDPIHFLEMVKTSPDWSIVNKPVQISALTKQ